MTSWDDLEKAIEDHAKVIATQDKLLALQREIITLLEKKQKIDEIPQVPASGG